MRSRLALTLAMLAGFALGAVAVQSVHAQRSGPGAYAIIDITEVTSPQGLNEALAKLPASVAAFGGKFVTRTENILGFDGVPPLRFFIIAFDTMEKAQSWNNSPAQTAINQARMQATSSSSFAVGVEGAQ
jgi:uncharacterized protein (DUF1330 family)